jgi:photosystem II stability/assembly factor-like uncharacterized protein
MKSYLLFLSIIVLVHPVLFAAAEDSPSTIDHAYGWRQKETDNDSKTLHMSRDGEVWIDVSPAALKGVTKRLVAKDMSEFLGDAVALAPLDSQTAWISLTHCGSNNVLIESTHDGGLHWKEMPVPIEAESAPISFPDITNGFLLALGQPAAGLMDKTVYEDGGAHWRVLNKRPARACYPTGITFRTPLDGWIGATYHGGDDDPLYRSQDGGKTWTLQQIPIPDDYKGGYANIGAPVFFGPDKKQGYLQVHLVRHEPPPDHDADVRYETGDGGATWHLPASGVQSNRLH